MKLIMCSIRDSKTEAYLTPMFFQTAAQAIRSFQDAVNGAPGQDNYIAQHPEDYVLFEIAHFFPDTGNVYVLPEGPKSLGVGVNYVRPSPQLEMLK